MSEIRVLPGHVADLIAAGEVVERPASAAKELIENSVDAGASAITVEAQGGGITLLRVTDDGRGISPEDAKTAFTRHATSKIRSAEDLAAVKTLGFRGEALAALAAVSRIDMLTRESGADFGVSVRAEGGIIHEPERAGCPSGTTIVVRDMFYNTPARHKFLKKDNYESLQIQGAVVRAAQSRPDITFTFIRDGREEIRTPGSGELAACLHSLWGRDAARRLLKVQAEHAGMKLNGCIGNPSLTRGSREMQHFFVNGRPVRSRTMYAAMEEAFRHSAPQGRFPVCSLHLSLPEQLYDVNVHPAKLEVKFADERSVFEIIYAGTRDALNEAPAAGEWKTAVTAPPSAPPREGNDHPAASRHPSTGRECSVAPVHGYAATRINTVTVESPAAPQTAPVQTAIPGVDGFRYIGEVLGGFLLAEQGDSLIIIDKHAAHERKLFDELVSRADEAPMAQTLIAPVVAALPPGDCAVILENEELFGRIGFDLGAFGSNSVAVRSVPDGADISDIAALLSEMAEILRRGKRSPWEERRAALLEAVACKAAVKLGGRLSEAEAREAVRWVLTDKNIRSCPHGRPVAAALTRADMNRQFLR